MAEFAVNFVDGGRSAPVVQLPLSVGSFVVVVVIIIIVVVVVEGTTTGGVVVGQHLFQVRNGSESHFPLSCISILAQFQESELEAV